MNFAVLQLASEVIEQDRRLPLLALFGHSVISKLGLLSGVRRKSDFELAKGGFWRKADTRRDGEKAPMLSQCTLSRNSLDDSL